MARTYLQLSIPPAQIVCGQMTLAQHSILRLLRAG